MEHAVAVALQHLGMDVETGVAQLGDFLCQQLHPVDRVTEDDGLIDLQLQCEGAGQPGPSPCESRGIAQLLTLENNVFRQCTFCFSSTNA